MAQISFLKIRPVIRSLLVCVCVIGSLGLSAQQEGVDVPVRNSGARKGGFTFYWGWNRAMYSKSDLHFSGRNYDFVLHDVPAHDRQSEVAIDPYLKIKSITIPQVNYRIGYFVNNHLEVSFGVDHMKYVMYNDVEVEIDGYIKGTGTPFDNEYEDDRILLEPNFLLFEHTDGLNYVNAGANYYFELARFFDRSALRLNVDGFLGGSAGFMYPKTNTTLLNTSRYDEFHLSGYGMALESGLRAIVRGRYFVHSEGKLGYINMPDVRTTASEADKAEHSFFFYQVNFGIGFIIHSPNSK